MDLLELQRRQEAGDTRNFLAMLNAANQRHVAPDDYRENGVLRCGKCGKAKEKTVHMDGSADYAPMDVVICLACSCVRDKDRTDRAKAEARAEEEKRRREINWLRAEGLGGKYRDHRFENDKGLQSPKVVEACKAYTDTERWKIIKSNGYGLLLWGDVGTGKTYLAGCVANALIDKGIPVYMRTASDIVDMPFDDFRTLTERIRRYHLYILDDLGAERKSQSGYAQDRVKAFVDAIYEAKRPLIVTTNLTADELENPFAPIDQRRTYDRVREMCATRLLCQGESVRGGIADENRAAVKGVLA